MLVPFDYFHGQQFIGLKETDAAVFLLILNTLITH